MKTILKKHIIQFCVDDVYDMLLNALESGGSLDFCDWLETNHGITNVAYLEVIDYDFAALTIDCEVQYEDAA